MVTLDRYRDTDRRARQYARYAFPIRPRFPLWLRDLCCEYDAFDSQPQKPRRSMAVSCAENACRSTRAV